MESDPIWKKAIQRYIDKFFEFFFPEIFYDIDFSKGVKFYDKELQKITKDSKIGKRVADTLIEVKLKNGDEKLILIHVEVQSYPEKEFSKRMFTYNYKIYDRYEKEVVSLAILADEDESFRDNVFQRKRWGFELRFEFPYVKLLDYRGKEEKLKKDDNPFSVIVLTFLKEFESENEEERYVGKLELIKSLYDKGYTKEDVLMLYEFIDWMMRLPEDLDRRLYREIEKIEEVRKVRFVTTAERIGMEKGLKKGMEKLKEILKKQIRVKFKDLPEGLERLIDESPVEKVEEVAVKIFDVESLDEIERILRS